jgi:hypothetical protein
VARKDRKHIAQQFVGFAFQKFVFKTLSLEKYFFIKKASKHSKIVFDHGRKKVQILVVQILLLI